MSVVKYLFESRCRRNRRANLAAELGGEKAGFTDRAYAAAATYNAGGDRERCKCGIVPHPGEAGVAPKRRSPAAICSPAASGVQKVQNRGLGEYSLRDRVPGGAGALFRALRGLQVGAEMAGALDDFLALR